MTRVTRLMIAAFLAIASPAPAAEDLPAFRGLPEDTLFALPFIAGQMAGILESARAGQTGEARIALARLADSHPGLGPVHIARAALEARAEDRQALLAALEAAAATGQAGLATPLDGPEFDMFRSDPAFEALYRTLQNRLPPAPARPALIAGGTAPVTGENTVWDRRRGLLLARFEPQITRPDLPVIAADRNGPADQLLRRLHARGQAAGNWGDLYDNRDDGHSRLSPTAFPQLSHITYGPAAGLYDAALPGPLIFERPVIGNASLAITGGPLPRSLPRRMMTGGRMAFFADDTRQNRLLVFPEHQDHDPKYGDRFPAISTAVLISQGSSGSDIALVEALAMTLAAFRPDTKEQLIRDGLIAPTLQMILRRTYGDRQRAADYLTPAAHPTAFDGARLNPVQMVGLANAIAPEEIPPAIRLDIVEDLAARPGIDYLDPAASEDLFTTPGGIARIWRSYDHSREMVLSAGATRDPNGRPLTFRWVLLRGDPDKVTITPSQDGTEARIRIAWHDPYPAPGSGIPTHRIDIAVIADNGAYLSAPAFLSVAFPPNETRIWEAGPDGPRLKEIAYTPAPGTYADPALFTPLPWRDVMDYGGDGTRTGWIRLAENGTWSQIRLGPDGPDIPFEAPSAAAPAPVAAGKGGGAKGHGGKGAGQGAIAPPPVKK